MISAYPWLPIVRADLKVRHIYQKELPELYELEADPFLKKYVGGPIVKLREDWLSRANSLCSSDITFAIEHIPSGKFAGRASLGHFTRTQYPNRAHREVQVILSRAFVGAGLGRDACILMCTLAFESFEASSVFAVVHHLHPRSANLVLELGFNEIEPDSMLRGQSQDRIFELSKETFSKTIL